jgi:hypothetical protein
VWRFYNPITKCVLVSRDAIFEEDRNWYWGEEYCDNGEPFKMEYVPINGMLRDGDRVWPGEPQGALSPGVHELSHAEPFTPPARQGVEHAT